VKEKKMTKTKRSFSQEFKDEAVDLAKREGNSKAARDLGVNEACIRNWRNKQESPKVIPSQTGTKKSYDELEKENRKLEKENGYLREINKVLKKSTAIFSADHMGFLK
jgi:transposase